LDEQEDGGEYIAPYLLENKTSELFVFYQHGCKTDQYASGCTYAKTTAKQSNILAPYSSTKYAFSEPGMASSARELWLQCVDGPVAMKQFYAPFGTYSLSNVHKTVKQNFVVELLIRGRVRVLCISHSGAVPPASIGPQGMPEGKLPSANTPSPLPRATATVMSMRLHCYLAEVGVSVLLGYSSYVNVEQLRNRELLYLCAQDMLLDVLVTEHIQQGKFLLGGLQVDNPAEGCKYPVVFSTVSKLSPRKAQDSFEFTVPEHSAFVSSLIGESLGRSRDIFSPVLRVIVSKNVDLSETNFMHFNLVLMSIAEFHLQLETSFLANLQTFLDTVTLQQRKLQSNPQQRTTTSSTTATSSDTVGENLEEPLLWVDEAPEQVMFFDAIVIHSIKFNLSVTTNGLHSRSSRNNTNNKDIQAQEGMLHALQSTFLNLNQAPIQFSSLRLENTIHTMEEVGQVVTSHYRRQALTQSLIVFFGSSDIFGNPFGLLSTLKKGVRDFIMKPSLALVESPQEVINGVLGGTFSLLHHGMFAASDASARITKSIAKGLSAVGHSKRTLLTGKLISYVANMSHVVADHVEDLRDSITVYADVQRWRPPRLLGMNSALCLYPAYPPPLLVFVEQYLRRCPGLRLYFCIPMKPMGDDKVPSIPGYIVATNERVLVLQLAQHPTIRLA
jgi:hypothetical protein